MTEEDIAEMEAEMEGDALPQADDFDGEEADDYPYFDDEEPDIDEAQEWADLPYGSDEDAPEYEGDYE